MTQKTLSSSIAYLILGSITLICGILLVIVAVTGFAIDDTGEFWSVIAMMAVFTVGGLWMISTYNHYKVILDGNSLTVKGYFGGVKEIKWADVHSLTYKRSRTILRFKTGETSVDVEIQLVGEIEFLNALNMMVPEEHLNRFMESGNKFYFPNN